MKRSSLRRSLPWVVILGGFALRLYRLGVNSLWYDETVSLLLARADLGELIRHTAGDIHPPGYYFLLFAWGRLAGWSEFAAAFLSLWFGVLLIALVYRVGRAWFLAPDGSGERHATWIALLAALFVAVSPYNVWYSQEVRMYTVGAVLGVLSVYFLRRMLLSPHTGQRTGFPIRDFLAYVVVTALGMYVLYYFVFLLVFEWLWVGYCVWQALRSRSTNLQSPNLQSLISTFLLSQFALIVLYLPWLPIAVRQTTDPPVPPWRGFIALPQVIAESVSALAFGQAVDPWLFMPLALVLIIPLGIVLFVRRAPWHLATRVSPWFLLGYTFVPLAAIYLLSLWKPLYHVRYLFTYSPGFYLLAALALYVTARGLVLWNRARRDALPKLVGAAAVIAVLAYLGVIGYALNNYWHNEQYAEDDLRGAVSYLAERWRPGDAILVNAGYAYPALVYYFPIAVERERLTAYTGGSSATPDEPLVLETGSIGGAPNLGWGDPLSDFYATTAEETRAALDRVFADHPRVWELRLYDTVVDPDGIIRTYFDQHATLLDDRGFTGESQVRVRGYLTETPDQAPAEALPDSVTRLDRVLGERVQLAGYDLASRDVAHGMYLGVALYWKLLQAVNYNYQVTLQLLNANGDNVLQTDEVPLSELLPMTRWTVGGLYREPLRLRIPDELPAGQYKAIIKLYNPRDLEVIGDVVDLGAVNVGE